MRKLFLVALCLVGFTVAATAGKIDTKWHCGKATAEHSFDVGDTPNHTYAIGQGTCTASGGSSGEKSGTWTQFINAWKEKVESHGHFNVTMDDGDMVYYTYTESSSDMKHFSNKWKIEDGTGKHKSIKGSGTCSGMQNDDGSSDWTCTGTTTMTAASAKKKG